MSRSAQDAIDLATALNHKAPSATLQIYACDLIYSRIWTKFIWNWTKQSITDITLTDGVQDYALASADATVFYRFGNLEVKDTSQTPTPRRWLSQKDHLSVEVVTKGGLDSIRFYSWESTISKLRLNMAAAVPSGTVLKIEGEIQTTPTEITGSTLTTALLLPDYYFQVFLEGVRWKFYELTDDSRAGALQVVGNKQVYSGQLGVFMDALLDMAKSEDFSNAEDVIYPAGGTLGRGRDDAQLPRIFG